PRVVIQDHPESAVRGIHVQGYDKGYGVGNRWTVQDLIYKVPRLIDVAAKARITFIRIPFEAGWINKAGQKLGVNIDEIMDRLIAYGKKKMVNLLIEVEYRGWQDDRSQAEQVIEKYNALNPNIST